MSLVNSLSARDAETIVHTQTNLDLHRRIGATVVTHGKGVFVYDETGREFLDTAAGLWCAALGFENERLARAAYDQMRRLGYYHTQIHYTHPGAVELAERLLANAPVPMSKVLFQCSGSEANDYAIKLAWYYQHAVGRPQKRKIIGRIMGYHGSTVATTSVSGKPDMHADFGLPLDFALHAELPHYYRFHEEGESEEDFAARLAASFEELILREGPETIAAFIAEPFIGAGGVILPPRTYFDRIQRLLAKHDILFIADEVICGFGRTGELWGSTTFGLRPDLITCAKALSAGFQPISAILISERVYGQMLAESRKLGAFAHGATYSAHPVAVAVALEAQKIYEETDLLSHVRKVGSHLQSQLRQFASRDVVGTVEGIGLAAAVDLVADKETRQPLGPAGKVGQFVFETAREHGILTRCIGNRIALSPPLIISESEVDLLVERLGRVITAVEDEFLT